MPVPGDGSGAPKGVQPWENMDFWLATLDAKFAQQEQVIRELFSSMGKAPETGPRFLPPRLLEAESALSKPEMAVFHKSSVASDQNSQEEPKRTVKPTKKTIKTLGAQVMSEKWVKDPPMKAFVKEKLDLPIGIVVLVNVVLMIIESQWVGGGTDVSLGLMESYDTFLTKAFFEITEYCFFTIYLLDLVIRILVLRGEWYFDSKKGLMYMNVFDAFLVLLNFLELIVLPFWDAGNAPELNTNHIRLIKLTRVARTLRVVKTLSMLRQLRHLVATCIASIGALFWSLILLLFLKLIFALMISQTLQIFIQNPDENYEARLMMNSWYGTFSRSMYTFFEITYSGGWPLLVRPVLESVSAWYAIPFLIYVTLVVFATLRIVTALFLKETLSTAANDAEMVIEDSRRFALQYQKKLEELFRLVDDDSDGHLTAEEFVEAMALPSVEQYLGYLEITVRDCGPLFDILSGDDGLITISEFCRGIMQLKGTARSLDIVILQHENSKMMNECKKVRRMMERFVAQRDPD